MSRFPGDVATGLDLLNEWLAYPGLTGRQIHKLADAGVTSAAWIRAGHLATPRVQMVGRLYIPDPFGEPALVMRVYHGAPPSFENPDPSVPIGDLLAFHLEEPDRWYLRRGEWGLVLGMDQFNEAMVTGSRIILHATPLQWLRAGCEGACPLDLAEDWQGACRLCERLQNLEAA